MFANLSSLVCLIVTFFLAFLLDKRLKRRRLLALLPPSPKQHPLFGNLRDIPAKAPWKTYALWGRQLNSTYRGFQRGFRMAETDL
jgi:hypothetical protein